MAISKFTGKTRQSNGRDFTPEFEAWVCDLYTSGLGLGTIGKICTEQNLDVGKGGIRAIVDRAGIIDSSRADKRGQMVQGDLETAIADYIQKNSGKGKPMLRGDVEKAFASRITSDRFQIYYYRALAIVRDRKEKAKNKPTTE